MTLPKRDYFYLPEVVQKLGISEFDLQYYMSHGDLLGSFWLNKWNYLQSHFDPIKRFYVGRTPKTFEGYVTLSPNDCREVMETGFSYAHEFFLDFESVRLSIYEGQKAMLVRRSSLLVSTWDFEFFAERLHPASAQKKSGGRPSVMPLILEEHARRRQRGEACKNRMQEAQALYYWISQFHKDVAPPTRDSIRNALIDFDKKKVAA